MDPKKLEKILKELEKERDTSLVIFSNQELVDLFFQMQINIFVSTYFLAFTELRDKINDISSMYRAYFCTRISAVRYLLELYLSVAHIASLPISGRSDEVFSLAISEKINIHKVDLELHKISNTQNTQNKINENRTEYQKFIETFNDLSDKIPKTIDGFFINGILNKAAISTSEIKYFNHGKINYTEEIKTNQNIKESTKEYFLLTYSLLSLDVHPTISSLGEFEKFIGLGEEQKKISIQNKRKQLETLLKLISEQMLSLTRSLLIEKQKNVKII